MAKLIPGVNDLATVNPELAKEWHPIKNGDLTPNDVAFGSDRKVWWLGKCGHEWQVSPNIRTSRGTGCPYCSDPPRSVLSGYNDLATVKPDLAVEWHPTKNGDLKPNMVTVQSNKKVWWMCSNGHEWQAIISSRNRGNGCPYCSGHRVLRGFNDLATVNPELAKEWHSIKNGDLTPGDVTIGSDKKVWWRCNRGHEWQATIHSRTAGRGCPKCNSQKQTSFPEQALLFYIKQYCPDVMSADRSVIGMELDVYIPSKRVAIEYDGIAWHRNRISFDIKKNMLCKNHNIVLIRVRERGLVSFDDCVCVLRDDDSDLSLDIAIKQVLKLIDLTVDVDVNVNRDRIRIWNNYMWMTQQNSFVIKYPHLLKEWDFEKNFGLDPNVFSFGSNKKVWWIGKCGHEWQATVHSRVNGRGCPYCANRVALKGFNDLQIINPELAEEWHPTKNGNLTPSDVVAGSHKKVWWLGKCGHEWQQSVYHRCSGVGCPICAGKRVIVGFNDLATVNPELAKEWHPTRNGNLTPSDVVAGSHRKVWWRCHNGHEWQATVNSRSHGRGCPYCSNRVF